MTSQTVWKHDIAGMMSTWLPKYLFHRHCLLRTVRVIRKIGNTQNLWMVQGSSCLFVRGEGSCACLCVRWINGALLLCLAVEVSRATWDGGIYVYMRCMFEFMQGSWFWWSKVIFLAVTLIFLWALPSILFAICSYNHISTANTKIIFWCYPLLQCIDIAGSELLNWCTHRRRHI